MYLALLTFYFPEHMSFPIKIKNKYCILITYPQNQNSVI